MDVHQPPSDAAVQFAYQLKKGRVYSFFLLLFKFASKTQMLTKKEKNMQFFAFVVEELEKKLQVEV